MVVSYVREPKYDWAKGIYQAVQRRGGPKSPVSFNGNDLLFAFAYFDGAENLFNEHLNLIRYLLGIEPVYISPGRRTGSPLGPDMTRAIRAETVTTAEVERLITNEIAPLGSRQIVDEERLANAGALVEQLTRSLGGTDDKMASALRELVERDPSFLRALYAPPGEGIESLPKE